MSLLEGISRGGLLELAEVASGLLEAVDAIGTKHGAPWRTKLILLKSIRNCAVNQRQL